MLEVEDEYQQCKLELSFAYMECYEHTVDNLEQQQLIQIVVDLMARRPRINFKGRSFIDSYKKEIELL